MVEGLDCDFGLCKGLLAVGVVLAGEKDAGPVVSGVFFEECGEVGECEIPSGYNLRIPHFLRLENPLHLIHPLPIIVPDHIPYPLQLPPPILRILPIILPIILILPDHLLHLTQRISFRILLPEPRQRVLKSELRVREMVQGLDEEEMRGVALVKEVVELEGGLGGAVVPPLELGVELV